MWAPQLEGLAGEFRLVAPDLPGHGALHRERFSLDAAVGHLSQVIADLGEPATVVGPSLGGYLALELASRRPEQVRGLLLASCSAEPRYPLSAPYLWSAHATARLYRPLVSRVGAALCRASLGREVANAQLATGMYWDAFPDVLRAVLPVKWLPKVRKLTCPTLFVNGARDRVFRLEERRFAASAPQGELRVIAGAGHLVNLERPEAFNRLVREFARPA